MIIKAFELDQKKIKNIKFYLFYGSNKGYIDHAIRNLFKNLKQNNLQRYEENEVIKNSEEILEDFCNKSFLKKKNLF